MHYHNVSFFALRLVDYIGRRDGRFKVLVYFERVDVLLDESAANLSLL